VKLAILLGKLAITTHGYMNPAAWLLRGMA
jgi:hypothetical protein